MKISRQMIQRHKTLLTAISLFVVLTTFIVKEAWDEHLKELTAAVVSAEDHVQADERSRGLYYAIDEVQKSLNLLTAKIIEGKQIDQNKILLTDMSRTMFIGYEFIRGDLANMRLLVRDLPQKDSYLHRIEECEQANEKWRVQYSKWIESRTAEDFGWSQMISLNNDSQKLEAAVFNLRRDAQKEAEGTREWNEKYHKVCAIALDVLFGLGLIVTLISNMAGIKTEGESAA